MDICSLKQVGWMHENFPLAPVDWFSFIRSDLGWDYDRIIFEVLFWLKVLEKKKGLLVFC